MNCTAALECLRQEQPYSLTAAGPSDRAPDCVLLASVGNRRPSVLLLLVSLAAFPASADDTSRLSLPCSTRCPLRRQHGRTTAGLAAVQRPRAGSLCARKVSMAVSVRHSNSRFIMTPTAVSRRQPCDHPDYLRVSLDTRAAPSVLTNTSALRLVQRRPRQRPMHVRGACAHTHTHIPT